MTTTDVARHLTLRTYLLICGLAAHVVAAALLLGAGWWFPDHGLGEILHKGQQRLSRDHPTLASAVGATLTVTGLDRQPNPVPVSLPSFPGPEHWPVHGTRAEGFEWLKFDASNVPQQMPIGSREPPPGHRIVPVSDAAQLRAALKSAQAGDVVTLDPGSYQLRGHRVELGGAGTIAQPIYVRARRIGEVIIELDTLEGVFVDQPFWVFENLVIRGVCQADSRCEHAFHVVGSAHATTLRNNAMIDFNAPLKVNGLFNKPGGVFPDNGLVHNNHVFNTRPRRTGNPVTLLNINGGDSWVVSANFIADFVKQGGDQVSYAAFMKSNASHGVFERNLVVCHWQIPYAGETRVGLSFGGGGTQARFVRGGGNSVEHNGGIMRNNVILRCPTDVGIYLNKAAFTQIHNNLVAGSRGIDVRFASSTASIHNNVVDGRVRDRDGGYSSADTNLIESECSWWDRLRDNCGTQAWYKAVERGDLRPASPEKIVDQGNADPRNGLDFCGNRRTSPTDIGPIEYGAGPSCLPASSF